MWMVFMHTSWQLLQFCKKLLMWTLKCCGRFFNSSMCISSHISYLLFPIFLTFFFFWHVILFFFFNFVKIKKWLRIDKADEADWQNGQVNWTYLGKKNLTNLSWRQLFGVIFRKVIHMVYIVNQIKNESFESSSAITVKELDDTLSLI